MGIEIVAIRQQHIEDFARCLDSVARERRYLCFLQAPPLESVREFILGNIEAGNPEFVAVDDEVVIGWCDIVPKKMEGFRHIGTLGMGIKEGYRGQGIGSRLMESTLNRAKEIGLERVELDAFATNTNAIALYKKFGFEVEGVKKAARKLDGIVEDNICMAKLL